MKKFVYLVSILVAVTIVSCNMNSVKEQKVSKERKTEVTIVDNAFYINGEPTYSGRTWTTSRGESFSVEGLLMNSRMVQGIFDDLNPKTRGQWAYPDTKTWDPDRKTKEFIDAMPKWREYGLLSFTINLKG